MIIVSGFVTWSEPRRYTWSLDQLLMETMLISAALKTNFRSGICGDELVSVCCFGPSCPLVFWQADPGRLSLVQFHIWWGSKPAAIQRFSPPFDVCLRSNWVAARIRWRHVCGKLSLHSSEVSQVLLSVRLHWGTNYCQTTPMQKKNKNNKSQT